MKQAAYQGIPTNQNESTEPSNPEDQYDDDSIGSDIAGHHYECEALQQMIDEALHEMNNGDYEKAIVILEKAKKAYPNSQAEELQNVIVNLKLSSCTKKQPTSMPDAKEESLRYRKQNYSDGQKNQSEINSNKDYTNEQLDLVKKINICKNYYEVLSVSRESSMSEIKKSYKKLALQLHPDKNHAPGAAEAFKTLGNAMGVLSDDRKRKEYDIAGANYIRSNGNMNCHGSASPYQHRSHYMHHQQYHSHYSEATFANSEDYTAEELFHMFFGNYPSTQNNNYRRRTYQSANQRQPQEPGHQQPSMALGMLLAMIIVSMCMSLFSPDPLYSLSNSKKFNVRRQTQHLSIPYYVKENFERDYQGSLARLENAVEEDYIYTMKQHCFRERSYREAMMARARGFGSKAQFAQAQGLKMPSCDNLSKIGLPHYSVYSNN